MLFNPALARTHTNYLRKTISELALGDANPRLSNIDHYLLRRLLTALQVALLMSVVVGSGMAVAAATVSLLPPLALRQELSAARSALELSDSELQRDSAKAKEQDSDWLNHRPELVKQARDAERDEKTRALSTLRRTLYKRPCYRIAG